MTRRRAHGQVDATRVNVQDSERGAIVTPARRIFSTTLRSAAVGATAGSSASLSANAVNCVAQITEDFREGASLLLDSALSVADVSARGSGGCVDQDGQNGYKGETLHRRSGV